jgi:hypothetical protein
MTSSFHLMAGPQGWLRVIWSPSGPTSAFSEMTEAAYVQLARGDLRPLELRLIDPAPDELRRFPLVKIANAVHADPQLLVDLGELWDEPIPDGDLGKWFHRRMEVLLGPLPQETVELLATRERERFRLRRPQGRRLPDAFYADVARAYREAVVAGHNPRKALAQDSGTPADTVARWIGEARRRGYLPPGEPGKATAGIREEER